MARIEITGEQHSVGDIFNERFVFTVPPYQRPYAWTTEHVGELLSDLLGSLDDHTGVADTSLDDLNPYFLGSIVLIKSERPDAQVVDGQQRLISLTILLAALRELIPAPYADAITRRLYAPADPLNGIPARFRLRPKERDISFFQEFIQSEGGVQRLRALPMANVSDSQRNMRDNALFFLRQLSLIPEPRRVRLAQFIVQRCLVVVVTTPDLGSAYRIFSILNDRGLDLSSADILKAELIGRIPEETVREYTARWESAEESIGREAFEELFSDIRMIYSGVSKRGTLLDDFRTHVIPKFGDSQHLIDDAIVPLSAAAYIIRNSCYQHTEGAERVNAMLRWLNRIDNNAWIPPALIYFRRYHDQPERLIRFFTDLERLAASFMIRRQYANKRIARYARLIAAIDGGGDLSRPDSPMQLTAEEREATIEALSGDFYLMFAQPRQYTLLRLDSSLAGTKDTTYTYRTLTVEHVLPRHPAPDSYWARAFPTVDDHATNVHRLGNLVLLSRAKNSLASNYDFAKKKQVYFTGRAGVSPFALTTQVLQEEEWTPQVVQRRQRDLLAHLQQLWRL